MNPKVFAMGGAGALLGVVLLAGCRPDPHPATTRVTCTVSYRGEPVEGATVAYLPVRDARGRVAAEATSAAAVTDASGTARLRAYPEKLGALPGEYQVIITKIEWVGETRRADRSISETHLKALLPAKYSDYRTSGLKASVEKEPLEVHYELTD